MVAFERAATLKLNREAVARVSVPRNFLFLLVLLTPLLYALPGNFRVIVSVLAAAFAIVCRPGVLADWPRWQFLFVAAYAFTLIVQPMFIDNLTFNINVGAAICILAMFVPTWVLRSPNIDADSLIRLFREFVAVLSWVTVISIYSSYAFRIGHLSTQVGPLRAFSWLNDSYTPMIVFLLSYQFASRRYVWAALLLIALFMTVAKAAAIMLVLLPVVFAIFAPITTARRFVIIALPLCVLGVGFFFWDQIAEVLLPNVDYSFNNRILMDQVGWKLFLEHWVLGVGRVTIAEVVPIQMQIVAAHLGVNSHFSEKIYNAYIGTAAETGILGLLAVLGLSALWVTRAVQLLTKLGQISDRHLRVIGAACATWVVTFVVFYQTTGWFYPGEMQLAWLLILVAVVEAVHRTTIRPVGGGALGVGRGGRARLMASGVNLMVDRDAQSTRPETPQVS